MVDEGGVLLGQYLEKLLNVIQKAYFITEVQAMIPERASIQTEGCGDSGCLRWQQVNHPAFYPTSSRCLGC